MKYQVKINISFLKDLLISVTLLFGKYNLVFMLNTLNIDKVETP